MNKHATTEKPSLAFIGMLLAVGAAVLFSIKAIFIKLAYRHGVDAVTLLTLRMAFALPVFAAVAAIEHRKTDAKPATRTDYAVVAVLGLLGYYLASVLDFIGLQYVSAGVERLILFLFPAFTLLLSALFLGHRIVLAEVGALILSYIGIALSVQQEVSLEGDHALLGAALIFGSTLAFSLYLIGSGEMIPRIGARRFMALAMVVSCLAIIAQFLLTREPSALLLPLPVYGYALAIAFVSTVLPAFMLSSAIGRIGAAHTSIIGAIGPVVTIILAALLLGETMTGIQMVGAALVIGGTLLLGAYGRR